MKRSPTSAPARRKRRGWFERRGADSGVRKTMRTSIREGIGALTHATLIGGVLQTAFLLYLGFDSFQVGIVVAIPQLAFISQIVAAIGLQRWRNRRLWMIILGTTSRTAWVATGIIPLLLPAKLWFAAYVSVILIAFLLNQAGGMVFTSLLSDVVPAGVRGKYFGIRNMMLWAAVCMTLLVGGQILEFFPGGTGFAILFGLAAVCVVWNGWEIAKHPNPPLTPSGDPISFAMALKPLKDRRFRSALAFLSVFIFFCNIAVPMFAYVMLNLYELDYSTVTGITILHNVVLMISSFYWGKLSARYSSRVLLLAIFPLYGLSCLIWLGIAALPVIAVLIISHALLGVALGGYNLVTFTFLIEDSPRVDRPMYVALFYAATGIASFFGTSVGGRLFQLAAGGPEWLPNYGLIAMCGAAMLLLALAAAPPAFRNR